MGDASGLKGQALLDATSPEIMYSTTYGDPSEDFTWALLDDMMARPSLEESLARYREMLNKITSEISTQIPDMTWSVGIPPHGNSDCPYWAWRFTEAQTALVRFTASRMFTADEWKLAVAIMSRIGDEYGFTIGQADLLGEHKSLNGSTERGASLTAGTIIDSYIGARTDCLLPDSVRNNLETVGVPYAGEHSNWPYPVPTAPRYGPDGSIIATSSP